MRRLILKLLVITGMLVMLVVPAAAKTMQQDQLIFQAESYLELLDQDRYPDAWREMSTLFHALGNQDLWLSRQKLIRSAYGPLAARQFYRLDYRQSFNLSPDGLYVIVQFKSSYQHKAETTETVVLDCRSAPDCSIREYVIH